MIDTTDKKTIFIFQVLVCALVTFAPSRSVNAAYYDKNNKDIDVELESDANKEKEDVLKQEQAAQSQQTENSFMNMILMLETEEEEGQRNRPFPFKKLRPASSPSSADTCEDMWDCCPSQNDDCFEIDCCDGVCKWLEDCNGGCFSAMSTVHVVSGKSKGLAVAVPISDIRVGDFVQSKPDGSFSRVYALEKNHNKEAMFYQFHSSSSSSSSTTKAKNVLLELTARHMVYLKDKQMPVAAKDVKVGDILETFDEKKKLEKGQGQEGAVVKHIELIYRDGYYMPVTEDGTIIVNNIMASSFSEARRTNTSFLLEKTGLLHWHTVSQVGSAPLRFMCKAVWFGLCTEERFLNKKEEEGFHKFIVFLKDANIKYDDRQSFLLFLFFFGIGLLFSGLEFFYDRGEKFFEFITSTLEAGAGARAGPGVASVFSVGVLTLTLGALGHFALRKKQSMS